MSIIPNISYPVDGVVYTYDKTTALSGALVTAINITNSEQLPTLAEVTSNSSGQYIIDLANFTSGVSNNNSVLIRATKGNKISETLITVNTSTGATTQDLYMTYFDATLLLDDVLTDNWQSGRTDLITPAITPIYDKKRQDVNTLGTRSAILIEELNTTNEPNAIGTLTKRKEVNLRIHVKTTVSRLHLMKLKAETERILGTSIVNEVYGWDIIDPDEECIDKSDGLRNAWRVIMSIKLIKLNVTRSNEIWNSI